MIHVWGVGPSYTEVNIASSRAARADNKADAAELNVRRLAARMDGMALACQAMWELLQEKTELSDEDLLQRMQEVDLRDGNADGRLRATTTDCSTCGRTVNSRRGSCMYCGTEMQSDQVFDR